MNTFPPILLYHQVTPPLIDNQLLAVSPENFEAHLAWLASHKNVLPLPELLKKVENGDDCRDCIAITFDDGYADNLSNALKLLEKYHLPATFFVSTGLIGQQRGFWGDVFEDVFLTGRPLSAWISLPFLDKPLPCRSRDERLKVHDSIRLQLKYSMSLEEREAACASLLAWAKLPPDTPARNRMLTADEVKRLSGSQYATIGSHCVTHTRLSLLSHQEQAKEINESCCVLEELTGSHISCLAYPFGGPNDYDDDTRRLIAEHGLYGIAGVPVSPHSTGSSLFPADIPRHLVRNWNGQDFAAWLEGSSEKKHFFEIRQHTQRLNRVFPGTTLIASSPPEQAEQPMNIVYVNTLSGHGGAAASTKLLCDSLAKRGHKTVFLAGHHPSQNLSASCTVFASQAPLLIRKYCTCRSLLDYEYQGSHSLYRRPEFALADIVHLQNLHGGYFNPWSLSGLSHCKPVVWTLRDMQALTGHCAHAFDCEKWQYSNDCRNCPSLHTFPAIDRDTTATLYADKKMIYDHSQLWIVAPSTWMLEKVKNSILRDHPISLIHNAVDTMLFAPQGKQACRKKYGLPQDALLLGGSADSGVLRNQWKGGGHVLTVLDALSRRFDSLYFVNIGASPQEKPLRPNIINIPHTASRAEMAELYSCLDIFLYPTLADTAPLSVREALSCGVPVCGFNNGGMPDLVINGENGFLVPSGCDEELTVVTERVLKDDVLRHSLGQAGRVKIVSEFDASLMAEKYDRLYREAIKLFDPKFCSPFKLREVNPVIHTPSFYKLERQKLIACPEKHMKRRLFLLLSPVQYIMSLLFSLAGAIVKLFYIPRAVFRRLRRYSGCEGASKLKACGQIMKILFYRIFLIPRSYTPLNRVFGLNMGKSVSRYYIDSFIEERKHTIRGRVLEIGQPEYGMCFAEHIDKLDVLHAIPDENPYATIIGDLASGDGLPDKAFDCFILTQTLQCIYDARTALKNAYSLLKPGGTLLVTCPGLCQASVYDRERWGEYWRFTDQSLECMIAECCPKAESIVRTYGNLAVSKGLLDGVNAEKFTQRTLRFTDRDYQVIVAASITRRQAVPDKVQAI